MNVRNSLRSALLTTLMAHAAITAFGQCPNDNVLYASFSPACPTSATVPCIWGGEYVLVNVVAGTTYTFSTCGTAAWDTQITLYSNSGGGSLGYNDDACGLQSSVTWTATFTGQIRVLVDQYFCTTNFNCADLVISCNSPPPPPPPPGDCVYILSLFDSFGDGWGSSSVGVSINGGPYTYYTVTGSSNQVLIGVNIGDVVVLNYNNSGSWQNENSYTLGLQGGGQLYSSGTAPAGGVQYAASVNCQPPPSPPQDCAGAFGICSDQSFNNNSNNTGNVVDLTASNQGCLSGGERQGTWYSFSPSASGTLGFTITPTANVDYDYAIWGPMTEMTCPPAGQPIRCSWAYPPNLPGYPGAQAYLTGLGNGATDVSEGASGGQVDGFTAPLNVTAGDVYILFIDNFDLTGQSFSLDWELTNGASLDCTVLPVVLLGLAVRQERGAAIVEWMTVSELHSRQFVVERSADGHGYASIGQTPAAGNSSGPRNYHLQDTAPLQGLSYYRLRSVDLDGSSTLSHAVPFILKRSSHLIEIHPNPAGDQLQVLFTAVEETHVHWHVLDASGRLVMSGQHAGGPAPGALLLDIQGLEQGSYTIMLRGTSDRPLGTARFVKE